VLTVVRKPPEGSGATLGQVSIEERSYEQGDALLLEIESFLDAVRTGRPPTVTGEDGLRALETALSITELVQGGRGRT
jgi:predicted dehydrogenase